jgi:metal-responsive CopG/Arc/MetJ family transcriptional regulator
MARTSKVAVTIDTDLLAQAEAVRRRTGESRSAVIARALRELLRAEERARDVRRYIEAYREQPETEDEIAMSHNQPRRAVRELPWRSRGDGESG